MAVWRYERPDDGEHDGFVIMIDPAMVPTYSWNEEVGVMLGGLGWTRSTQWPDEMRASFEAAWIESHQPAPTVTINVAASGTVGMTEEQARTVRDHLAKMLNRQATG